MMRAWRRLYRLRGLTPFGMLLVVLMAVLVVVDRATERWLAAAQTRDTAAQQLAKVRAVLDRSRKIEASLASARARLALVSGRVLGASDPVAAGKLLARATETWLLSQAAMGGTAGNATARNTGRIAGTTADRSLGGALRGAANRVAGGTNARATNRVAGGASERGAAGGRTGSPAARPAIAAAEVQVRVTPQQLLRALEHWHEAPVAMRLVRLELRVDNPVAPTALKAMVRVEGLYQSPQPGTAVRTRPSGARPANTQAAR